MTTDRDAAAAAYAEKVQPAWSNPRIGSREMARVDFRAGWDAAMEWPAKASHLSFVECDGHARAVIAAKTPFGSYHIDRTSDGYLVSFGASGEEIAHVGANACADPFAEAKACARSDYEARLLAAQPPTSTGEGA